jgi:hypothetical protein
MGDYLLIIEEECLSYFGVLSNALSPLGSPRSFEFLQSFEFLKQCHNFCDNGPMELGLQHPYILCLGSLYPPYPHNSPPPLHIKFLHAHLVHATIFLVIVSSLTAFMEEAQRIGNWTGRCTRDCGGKIELGILHA